MSILQKRTGPLLAEIGGDVARLFDVANEVENNLQRDERAFAQVNLKLCIALATRIQRRARNAKRAVVAAERSKR